jgi:multimeric flavodoxin WrbA
VRPPAARAAPEPEGPSPGPLQVGRGRCAIGPGRCASLGDYKHEHTKAWARTISGFDGFIFVTAEYNHSVPGVLKNALDFLYAEWNNKAAGRLTAARTGSMTRKTENRGGARAIGAPGQRSDV